MSAEEVYIYVNRVYVRAHLSVAAVTTLEPLETACPLLKSIKKKKKQIFSSLSSVVPENRCSFALTGYYIVARVFILL